MADSHSSDPGAPPQGPGHRKLQLFSATSTSSSIFFASPNSIRLFSFQAPAIHNATVVVAFAWTCTGFAAPDRPLSLTV
jgi:hypothetical protein